MAQYIEPCRDFPVRKAAAIGRNAIRILKMPVSITRKKYSFRQNQYPYATAIPRQMTPAMIVS